MTKTKPEAREGEIAAGAKIVSLHADTIRVSHPDGTPDTTYQLMATVQATLNGVVVRLTDLIIGDTVTLNGEPVQTITAVREVGVREAIVPEIPPPDQGETLPVEEDEPEPEEEEAKKHWFSRKKEKAPEAKHGKHDHGKHGK